MAYDIGPRIGIEGEKEFRKAIQDINTNLKTLGTEMQVVASQFDKNDKSTQALTARNEVLTKQIEAQKNKLSELQKGLAAAAEKYGENDRVTQGWQQAVNKATADLNNMERELKENEKAMKNAGDEMEKAAEKAEKSGDRWNKFTSVLKGVAVAAGGIAIAAGAAAAKLGKDVIAGFADYEQLIGGVETLFKDSAQKLQDYANNAYKTAGLSANDYMETVTSFSASLIQSLGGDTEKAVKYADMAITDMADNANKMGTDIQSIQNAYQGFAKQNYTMLDNLKLGYGGTKEEMERLLRDAEKISGIKLDISSYADVVQAIHIIQENMGIAGATAQEAEKTISGSVNAMKSAWENWIVGLGNTDADMKALTENLVNAFQNVVTNVVPIIDNLTAALPDAIAAIIPAVGELLPSLLTTISELFSKVLESILAMLPELVPAAVQAVMTIVDTIIDNLPLILDVAVQVILALVDGLTQALPELIPTAVDAVMKLAETLINNIDILVDAGIKLTLALAEGIINALPQLIETAPRLINEFWLVFDKNLLKILEAGVQLIVMLGKGIIQSIPLIIDNAGEIVKAIFNTISHLNLLNVGKNIITTLGQGLSGMTGNIITIIKEIMSKIISNFKSINWADVGVNIIKGIKSGIVSAAGDLVQAGIDAAKGALNGIKKFLGIKSPSAVMRDQVGLMIGEGIAEGIEDSTRQINAAMKGINKELRLETTVNNSGIGLKPSITIINQGTIVGRNGMQEFAQIVSKAIGKDYGLAIGGAY